VLTSKDKRHAERSLVTDPAVRHPLRDDVRILMAEDNVTNQQVALFFLRKMGLSADVVANGAEAVKTLETVPYDLVLMDVQMPEMDGYEATRVIRDPRSSVLNHAIPIIAMTAHALREERERCLQAGMNDYLSKPLNRKIFVDVLEKWLPGRRVVDETR
jgi:CheY-like chemotaxis protein